MTRCGSQVRQAVRASQPRRRLGNRRGACEILLIGRGGLRAVCMSVSTAKSDNSQIVDTLTSSAHERRKSAGLSTCSITSIEHTTSYLCGSLIKVSAAVCLYVNEPREGSVGRDKAGSAAECSDAIAMFFSDASMASVRAPSRAKLYDQN